MVSESLPLIKQTMNLKTLASKSYSFALAGSKELYSSESILNGVTKLSIKGNSWLARQYVDGKDDLLADLQTDAHYLRINARKVRINSQFERESSTYSTYLYRNQK